MTLLLEINLETTHVHKDICVKISITVLFVTAEAWDWPKCPLVGEQVSFVQSRGETIKSLKKI